MNDRILTTEEYSEKLNSLIKPMVDMAIDTQEFKETGCYAKEFIADGHKEIAVMIVDKHDWVAMKSYYFNDLITYRGMYHQRDKECEELQEKLAKYEKRKGILDYFKR